MKRLVLFALLLVLGFVALRLAIGDEHVVTGKAADEKPQAPAPTPAGISLPGDSRGMTASSSGALDYRPVKSVPLGDGRSRIEPVYHLKSPNNRTIAPGQQQLDDAELVLFDDGEPSAKLTCKVAFVTLRPDATGKPSLDESKDLDLRQAVFEALPGSRMAGLRLELGTARVRIEENALVLTTPVDQPVVLVMQGEQPMTLRGLGVQAMLPRRGTGKQRDGDLRRADVEILKQPVLTSDGVNVHADGRLHFVEDLDLGTGTVTLNDAVAMDVTRSDLRLPGKLARSEPATAAASVRGDQFVGWLARVRETGDDGKVRQRLDWRQLVLTGAPAVVDIPGSRLATPRVTVLPGPFGEPALLTAHGGESRLEQTTRRPGSKQEHLLVGTSSRRMHFVMPKEQLGAVHRAFGFPRWSLRQIEKLQVVVVEGAARVQNGPATYEASDGIRLYRREDLDTGIVRGLGRVHVQQPAANPREEDLVATGTDGFLLRTTKTFEQGRESKTELLQLGPPLPATPDDPGPWREHEFDVRYGDAMMRGRGAVEVVRLRCNAQAAVGASAPPADDVRLRFLSPDAGMAARVPVRGLDLHHVRSLRARFVDRVPVELDIGGWPLQFALARGDETLAGTAPRLVQVGPQSIRLLPPDGADAALWSGLPAKDVMPRLQRNSTGGRSIGSQQIDVHGPAIDVHHLGAGQVLVDAAAVGDELPRIYARIAMSPNREATTIACVAERLRVLPFVAPPEARRWLARDAGFAFELVAFHDLSRPWLVVDRVREFQLDDPEQGHVEGEGRTLMVGQGGRAALFLGDPETLTPAEITRTHEGRITKLSGARVRVFQTAGAQLQALGAFDDRSAFLAPTMTLHDATAGGLLAHMQATCRGNIDVLPTEVVFGGPVNAFGLRADGSVDPNGIAIDARELHMVRKRETVVAADGKKSVVDRIASVTGKQVVVDWSRLHARCAEVELDVERQRLVARDPDEAHVVLRNGVELFSRRIEVDYRTLAYTMSSGRTSRRAPLARQQ